MTRLALYRPFRFAVAIALLLSMTMPLVTYACDLTGLIETHVTMARSAGMSESVDADCPFEHAMQDMRAPRATDGAVIVNCHADVNDSEACCSPQPELQDAVSPSKQLVDLQPALVGIAVDGPIQPRLDTPIPVSVQDPAPPVEASIHILHSSLLL